MCTHNPRYVEACAVRVSKDTKQRVPGSSINIQVPLLNNNYGQQMLCYIEYMQMHIATYID